MSFVAGESLKWLGVSTDVAPALENPLSLAASHLRPALLPGILSTASLNLRRGAAEAVRLFEIGPAFHAGNPPKEELRMAIVIHGPAEAAHFSKSARPADFFDLKGILATILKNSGHADHAIECIPAEIPGFDPSASAAVRLGDRTIGGMGRIADATAKKFDLPEGADRCPNCDQPVCPECGSATTEDAIQCAVCGAQFAFSCPECGHDVPADALSCPNCHTVFET